MRKLALVVACMAMFTSCGTDGGDTEEGTCTAIAGDLVITEAMANAKGSDVGQEWIEVYNASADVQVLNGCAVTVQGTNQTRTHFILSVDKEIEVAPGAYAVLGAGSQAFLTYSWAADTTFAAGAFFDTSATISLTNGAAVVDSIAYGEVEFPTCPKPAEGETLALCPSCIAANCNDVADVWKSPEEIPYDAVGNVGSPGAANEPCECFPPAGVATLRAPQQGDLAITEIFADTIGTEDTNKEWLEIHVLAQDAAIDFAGVGIVKTKGELPVFTIGKCYAAAPGEYVVLGGSIDPAANGGADVDIEYEGLSLNNSKSYLALVYNGATLTELEYEKPVEGKAKQLDEAALTWCEAKTTYGVEGAFGTPGAANPPCTACFCMSEGQWVQATLPSPGGLFITEILPNTPGDEKADREWFELLVTGTGSVDLNCVELWKELAGEKAAHVVATPDNSCLRYAPGSTVLFARSNDPAVNGIAAEKVDYVYTSMTLSNDGDLVLKAGGAVVEQIHWDGAEDGVAYQKDAATGQWCGAVTQYWTEPGGTAPVFGTPGDPNTPCGVSYCNENGAPRPVASPAVGELVISEIFANPQGADATELEWVEVLVMPSALGKDLNGIELLANGSSKGKVGGESADCKPIPGDTLLLVKTTDAGLNGNLPPGGLVVSSLSLGNSNATLALSVYGQVIDSVAYADAPDGRSLQLDPGAADAVSNDDPASWCDAQVAYNTTPSYGTPAGENTPCGATYCTDSVGGSKQVTPPTVGGLVITEIYSNTAGAEDVKKEWFEVTVPNGAAPFQLNGTGILTAVGKPPEYFFSSDHCIELAPGGVYVFCRSSDPAENDGLPAGCIPYSSVTLINDYGFLGLGIGGTLYDIVSDYGKTTDGVSRMLDSAHYNANDNDVIDNWCDTPAGKTFGTSGKGVGTPGALNPTCP